MQLTSRQRQILCLGAQGMTHAAVGARLGLSASTVRNHLQAVYDKLGLYGQRRCLVVAVLVAMMSKQVSLEELAMELL